MIITLVVDMIIVCGILMINRRMLKIQWQKNQRSGYYVVKQMTMIKKMMQRSLVFLFDKLELDGPFTK